MENARFGRLDSDFSYKSRDNCSFWALGLSFSVKVWWKLLLLEGWIFTFGESLLGNARFANMSF